MMTSDNKDSLTGLINNVDAAIAGGACQYFSELNGGMCGKSCPSFEHDQPCASDVLEDVSRRLHALMPHDAKGVEIRPGDTIELKGGKSRALITDVLPIPVSVKEEEARIDTFTMLFLWRVVSPDSWERLEEDVAQPGCCEYFHCGPDVETCDGCPALKSDGECFQARAADIVRRAKVLAGVE